MTAASPSVFQMKHLGMVYQIVDKSLELCNQMTPFPVLLSTQLSRRQCLLHSVKKDAALPAFDKTFCRRLQGLTNPA